MESPVACSVAAYLILAQQSWKGIMSVCGGERGFMAGIHKEFGNYSSRIRLYRVTTPDYDECSVARRDVALHGGGNIRQRGTTT